MRDMSSGSYRKLHDVLASCLDLISSSSSQAELNTMVERSALDLRTKLADFHNTLHAYREIEATEDLIAQIEADVAAAEKIESDFRA